jgi:hypothetical protein
LLVPGVVQVGRPVPGVLPHCSLGAVHFMSGMSALFSNRRMCRRHFLPGVLVLFSMGFMHLMPGVTCSVHAWASGLAAFHVRGFFCWQTVSGRFLQRGLILHGMVLILRLVAARYIFLPIVMGVFFIHFSAFLAPTDQGS